MQKCLGIQIYFYSNTFGKKEATTLTPAKHPTPTHSPVRIEVASAIIPATSGNIAAPTFAQNSAPEIAAFILWLVNSLNNNIDNYI